MTWDERRVILKFIEPWIGLADDDEEFERFRTVDSNSESEVRGLIKSDLMGGYEAMSTREQTVLRDALKVAINSDDALLERLWDAELPPFDLPDRPASLFEWMLTSVSIVS